ncbi:MAG: 4Fe-4S binding protein [Candidatus Zixiibacteriota bacterium]
MKTKPYLTAIGIIAAAVLFSTLSVNLWGDKPEKIETHQIIIDSPDSSPAAIAKANNIPLKPVLMALKIDSTHAATTTLTELNLTTEQAAAAIGKMMIKYSEEQSKNWMKIFIKFLMWFIVLPIPFVLMLKRKLTPRKRKILLASGFVIFGIVLGSDPSPMGTVKDAVYLIAAHETVFWPRIVALGIFLLTVVLANKFICSWGCQFGLLQDFLFRLGRNKVDRKGIIKQYKPPFWLSNGVRITVFVAFTLIGVLWAFDFIGAIDPFKIFNPTAMTAAGIIFVAIVLVAALFVYRPWCHFACPFGLVSWFFEKLAIFNIKVDYTKCTACQACNAACPSTVMDAILKKDKTIPDCFACGICIESCPTDAVSLTARHHARFDITDPQNADIAARLRAPAKARSTPQSSDVTT